MRLEGHPEGTLVHGARGRERGLHGRGVMGVVVDNGHAARGPDWLEAAPRAAEVGERRRRLGQGHALGAGNRQRGQRVGHVVAPDERQPHRGFFAIGRDGHELHAVAGQRGVSAVTQIHGTAGARLPARVTAQAIADVLGRGQPARAERRRRR